ncbi:NADH-quinone oxidoreductase subunit C [Dehalogenimonas alkenigignens]|uniref:NADH dehydrogenase subunit C n=1 Tax=Dehalogenimonas alkenigignens TaxID=1217799 RepID=A0A0W0GJB8_9CHLR|nr:NADH-quinone oxidoreductase subunit C [Dehalogenimonas alkenigignens]KTB48650.1 NADH dehydrogenase subunit C [Dehalogenimonas alkenigignens]PVV84919.1 NADH-quinone oxidoreductase subunit C [Dehalogenimonas alkenigignens]
MKDIAFIEIAALIRERFGDGVAAADDKRLIVEPPRLAEVAAFLRDDPNLNLDYLSSVTAIDHKTDFTLIYHLYSLTKNQRLTMRVPVVDRVSPAVPSVTPIWRGADLQEREIFDLFGIEFSGHPNLKRLFMWEGFPGFPLRKDWVNRGP